MYTWGDNRRFNSYTSYIKRKFGARIQKLTVDAGFTCPNRDGTLGVGGCTYCNNDSFNPSYCSPHKSITVQLSEGIEFHQFRYRRAKNYLAYFQAYSNTYAPLNKLEELYNDALSFPNIMGLVIGTRPDCVDIEKLDYLSDLAKKYYISIEFGVESCNNNTLMRINRGHTFEKSEWAITEAAKRGLNVGAHLIIGLPGESKNDILKQIDAINSLPLTSIKFHQLQIIKNTQMALDYANRKDAFSLFTMDGYLELMVDIIERLNPELVIERFSGEAHPTTLIAPHWGKFRHDQLLQKFEKLLEERNAWQGKLYNATHKI